MLRGTAAAGRARRSGRSRLGRARARRARPAGRRHRPDRDRHAAGAGRPRPGTAVAREPPLRTGLRAQLRRARLGLRSWTVGYEGRRDRLTLVRVATLQAAQRTPKRIGVGSRPRAVVAAYPGTSCAERYRNYRWDRVGRYLTIRAPNGRLTSFLVATPWYGRDRRQRVIEVMVSTRPRLQGERDWPCDPGWERE